MPRPHRNLRASLVTAITAGVLLFIAPTSAAAHDEFLSSYPEAGSTIGTSPTEITLSFSGELLTDSGSAVIEVLDAEGQNIAIDPPVIATVTATQNVSPDPSAGLFTVRWKVVSSDGHPISGEFNYTVEALTIGPTPGATATPTTSATPTQITETETAETGGRGQTTGGGEFLPVAAVLTGVGVVGATVIIVLMMGRERRRRDKAAAGDGS